MKVSKAAAFLAFLCAALLWIPAALAGFSQQGPKLVGTGGAVGLQYQGNSVAVSADGNTAIVGGSADNLSIGAAWVYTRSAGVWTQQGPKLVGTGAAGAAQQGTSVALSADGNTAIVGGYLDDLSTGAAWVWTRSVVGVWTQQGSKLVGNGAVGASYQGYSVALSADGNTAVVGGYGDDVGVGAAWVWTRSVVGVWTQQGSKLVGDLAVGPAYQGQSVTLSADGNTAVIGGPSDSSAAGAAWVWTRSGSLWTQQGSKLVGTGAAGAAYQGQSVATSADGNTAVVGGYVDNSNAGAAWVWTRSVVGVWTQQGSKLVGTGAAGIAAQGYSVALSADGNIAVVGGPIDNSGAGAAWVFTRSVGVWTQQGSKLVGTGGVGGGYQGYSAALSADGNTAVVGGTGDNSNVGAAWVFVTPVPYSVTYDGNGNTGGTAPLDAGSPYIPGTTVTVLGAGTLTKTGNTFAGWNTAVNGTGTYYNPGETFAMPFADVTLYAQWAVVGATPTLQTAKSRKVQGSAGTFNLPLVIP